jgi:hypothetical protein
MTAVPSIRWPDGKRFAFTVFDDPDSQPLEESRLIYGLLRDLGFRTTMGVWPAGPYRQGNSRSESCANPRYREHVLEMERAGFEIGFHGAALSTSSREKTAEALELFRQYFGNHPSAMANHFDNGEGIYFGSARLSGVRRLLYQIATAHQRPKRYSGHIPGDPLFWGDLCKDQIRYCRNFVFTEINTLRRCPEMPYYDPQRPYVRAWYASSEGADAGKFLATLSDANLDRLEQEGGACIMYTHFGKGFCQGGSLTPEFRNLMERLSRRNGWFAPVSAVLDHIVAQRGEHILTDGERARLEWAWLSEKLRRGTA